MLVPACPECASEMTLNASIEPNEIIECAECRSELEVMSLDPFIMALAPEVDEDWGE
jgi:alpha-aminoadipate/glutamate carrier protein LysW